MAVQINIEKLDIKEMFQEANDFNRVASLCEENIDISTGFSRKFAIQEIVNRAFACEIFLKALCVSFKINYMQCHNLKELFQSLPPETREKIYTEILSQIKLSERTTFDALIQNISNSFYNWRYIYEVDTALVNISFLKVFAEAVREIACQIIYKQRYEKIESML